MSNNWEPEGFEKSLELEVGTSIEAVTRIRLKKVEHSQQTLSGSRTTIKKQIRYKSNPSKLSYNLKHVWSHHPNGVIILTTTKGAAKNRKIRGSGNVGQTKT